MRERIEDALALAVAIGLGIGVFTPVFNTLFLWLLT